MRTDDLYLQDISVALSAIGDFVSGIEKETFLEVDLIRSAVIQKFTIIGEAASKISNTVQDDHPEIDWKTLKAFRNLLVHAYFQTTFVRVWNAAKDIDDLKQKIDAIIALRCPNTLEVKNQ